MRRRDVTLSCGRSRSLVAAVVRRGRPDDEAEDDTGADEGDEVGVRRVRRHVLHATRAAGA